MEPEDRAYMNLLGSRLQDFKGKRIDKLTDDEIREYLNIRSELEELLSPYTERIAEALQPVVKAVSRYRANVIGKD